MHTPEFDFEHDAGNVQDAIGQNHIRYPVAQDNKMATWNAWGNEYWPAEYLIDARGHVREAHFGEGTTAKTEASIRSLLRERGDTVTALGGDAHPSRRYDPAVRATPETYVGTTRAQGFTSAGAAHDGTHTYPAAPSSLPLSTFALSGTWTADGEHAVAGSGAAIDAEVQGKDVYLVLAPPHGGSGHVRVLLDGRPIPASLAGADAHGGVVTVGAQRLYHLVHAPDVQRYRLTLQVSPGVGAYAFTFG